MHISPSSINTFSECPRKFLLSRTWAPKPSYDMEFGTAMHKSIELGSTDNSHVKMLHPEQRAKLRALFPHVPAHPWGKPEVYFERSFGEDIVCGTMDSYGPDGIIEYKTTSSDPSYGSQYWERLCYAVQPAMYCYAMECSQITYIVIRVPREKPLPQLRLRPPEEEEAFAARIAAKVSASPGSYIHTYAIVPCGGTMERVRQTIALMHHCADAHLWPENLSACLARSRCGFWKVCREGEPPERCCQPVQRDGLYGPRKR